MQKGKSKIYKKQKISKCSFYQVNTVNENMKKIRCRFCRESNLRIKSQNYVRPIWNKFNTSISNQRYDKNSCNLVVKK